MHRNGTSDERNHMQTITSALARCFSLGARPSERFYHFGNIEWDNLVSDQRMKGLK
jgi:hypothetical protein